MELGRVVMDAGGGWAEFGLLGGGTSRLLKHRRGNAAEAGGEEHGWGAGGTGAERGAGAASSMPASRAPRDGLGLRQLACR
jgi:hypothetical protein